MLKYLTKIDLNKENVRNIPKEPGIYIYWDKEANMLYVGKSVALRNRVMSYLTLPLDIKTRTMISHATHFSYLPVGSEIEALLLEARLINLYKPQYNIELKDDKHPLYIRIVNTKYPIITTARKADITGAGKKENIAVFGPFPSSRNVKGVLKMIRKIIPFAGHMPEKRACIYNQIGLCDPCPSLIDNLPEEKKLSEGKRYRKNISLIRHILSGDIKKARSYLEKRMLNAAKTENFEKASGIKQQIERLDYITQPITQPFEFINNPNLLEDKRALEIGELKSILRKYFPDLNRLNRIECFDIAHLAGSSPTASMVTFIGGNAEKGLYRKFKINQIKGNDDISSLTEVAKRRIKHIKDWGLSDLIVVDGGKGQLMAFLKVFSSVNVPIVGLAKRYETLVIRHNGEFVEYRLKKGPAMFLLQRIRNESHRFARVYHHFLVSKDLFKDK